MTYIPDLAATSYVGLDGPIRAVGWLETPHPVNRGPVQKEFVKRLLALIEARVPSLYYMGFYSCTLCEAEGKPGPNHTSSQSVLLVPTANCVYESPIWIGHYVLEHSYCPPAEYCDAVTMCPEPGSKEFRSAIASLVPQLSPLAEDSDWGSFALGLHDMYRDYQATSNEQERGISEIKEKPHKVSVEVTVDAAGEAHLFLRVGPGENDLVELVSEPIATRETLLAQIRRNWRRLTTCWSGS